MAYTPEQIRQYGDQFLQTGDLQGLLTAAQQYGVPLDQLSGAYGLTGMQGEQYLNSNGFSAAPDGRFTQIGSTDTTFTGGADSASARNYLQGLVGNDLGAYDGTNTGLNDQILGSALASGRNLGDVMSMFPQFTQQQITDYYTQHQSGINAARDSFMQGQRTPQQTTTQPGPGGQGPAFSFPGMLPLSSASLQQYRASPYLDQIAGGLRDQFTQFMNDGLAANRGNAVANGSVGGSRQGIAEARTMTDAGKGFDSAIANLYGSDYNNQMNRNLQQYQGDQSYNLGLGNLGLGYGQLGLGYQNSMQGFYGQQRAQDMDALRLGADLYNMGNGTYLAQGQGMYGVGSTQQSAAWDPFNSATNIYQRFTPFGSTSFSGEQGGGASGALGGAWGAYQLYRGATGAGGSDSWRTTGNGMPSWYDPG